MKDSNKFILVFSVFISILTYQLWKYLLDVFEIKVFYMGMSLLYMGLSYVIWSECKGRFKHFCEAVFWLSVNNFIDELFFDPTKSSILEYVAFGVILLNFIYGWMNSKKK